MKPMAIADVYSFSITQTEGVRTYVSEHPRSEFVPESFEIYKDSERTEAIDGAISVTAGKVFYLYLGSFAPVGTSISYLADGFSVSCDSHDVVAFSNAITSSVIINAKKAGTYTVIITAGDIVKSVTVTATGAQQGGAVIPANTVPVVINSANSETRVEFTPDVTGSYTFTAPATVGVVEMSQDGTRTTLVDALTNTNGTPFTVTLEMNVTYVMLFTSSSVGTYYVPFTVVPADTDDGASVTEAELVIGSNEVRQANVTFIYVANSDGTLTLSTGAAINGNVTVSYSINGGEAVDIPLSSKAEISLSSGDEIRIFVIATGYSSLSATLS